jgi:uncharacterized membrane protein
MSFWNGVIWLHLVAMAFFVGGQLMLAGVVVPVLRRAEPDDSRAGQSGEAGGRAAGRREREPLRRAARRFGLGTVAAIVVLLITGAAMAGHFHKWGNSNLQVKLGLVALVAVLILAHLRRPAWHVLDAAIFLVSLAIVWLGIVVSGKARSLA